MYFPLFVGVLCLSFFVMHYFDFILVLQSSCFAMVALLLSSYKCIVTLYAQWLFLAVPRAGLQCVIVVFPDYTYFFSSFVTTKT